MRIVLIAVIIYAAYFLMRYIFKRMNNAEASSNQRKKRNYDPSNIQDADFEEIKKD